MKKNYKRGFLKWALATCLLLIGVQSSFAFMCEAHVYVKPPKSWDKVTLYTMGIFFPLSSNASGWYEIDVSKISTSDKTFFINSAGDYVGASWIDRVNYGTSTLSPEKGISCEDLSTGNLYIYEDPSSSGKTAISESDPFASQKRFHVVLTMNSWALSTPMISMDGGKTGKPMVIETDKCGWFTFTMDDDNLSDNVVLFRAEDVDRADMIGLNGNWETGAEATPIPLKSLFDEYGVNDLYFIPDQNELLKFGDNGFYKEYPADVEGSCSYFLGYLIYDTDASLHPAFSCYALDGDCQKGAQNVSAEDALEAVNACIGVTPGIVKSELDATTKKPALTEAGKKCFINSELFNQLFTPTEDVNEVSCFNMAMTRADDGKWIFDSDNFISLGTNVPAGFFPVETTDDNEIEMIGLSTPVADARTKHPADGGIFYGAKLRDIDEDEGFQNIDLICNGPGWAGGMDCSNLFGSADDITDAIKKFNPQYDCVFGWSCTDQAPEGWTFYKDNSEIETTSKYGGSPRWSSSVGRNPHFCMESHLRFVQKPGNRFAIRGDDDIWVYIDNKLAVDLGGTHLAAPGFVDLDHFEGTSGKLLDGKEYDLDIFVCDRRTTMSNLRINTNIIPVIHRGDDAFAIELKTNGAKELYSVSYNGQDYTCTDVIFKHTLSFYLVNGKSFDRESATLLKDGETYMGGISIQGKTISKSSDEINGEKGTYTVFAEYGGRVREITSFTVEGTDDVQMAGVATKSQMSILQDSRSFSIVNNNPSARTFAIFDMKGRVVRRGLLNFRETVIKNPAAGTYIVRVGHESQVLKIK